MVAKASDPIASRHGPRWHGPWREAIGISALLILLLVAFFWDAVFLGRALVAADLIYFQDSVWRVERPELVQWIRNSNLGDTIDQFYPWRAYVWTWLRRGEIPLWNPLIYGGMSLVGNYQSAIFYPLNLIAYLLPLPAGFTWTALARLVIAGLGMYGYLRVIGRGVVAAGFGAVSVSLSGWLVTWLGWPHVNVAVWLPSSLLVLELIFRSGRVRWALALALVIGAELLGGHAATVVHCLTVAAAYSFYLAWSSGRQMGWAAARQRIGLTAWGALLGLGLGAIQVAPFLEQLSKSSAGSDRARSLYASNALLDSGFWTELKSLPTIVFPSVFGTPVEPQTTGGSQFLLSLDLGIPGYNEYASYLGTLGIVFAVIAALVCHRDGRVRFWLLTGFVSLAWPFALR